MPLHIYYSDKIEDLADHLKGELVEERKKSDPFSFSTVVVPNTNIEKWLRVVRFADEPSLCMGIEFPFIENHLFKVLAGCLKKDGPRKTPKQHPDGDYAAGILSILLKDADPALAPFRRYVSGVDAGPLSIRTREEARMAWQLSSKLADLMDKYEVHRQTVVDNWLACHGSTGGMPGPGSVDAAEAALARKLFGPGGLFPPDGEKLSLRQLFDRVTEEFDRPPSPSRKIYFFGLSVLSSLQARILHWLARTHEVAFYHNDVCLEYWGDIETEGETVRRLRSFKGKDADLDLYEADESLKDLESSLLRRWGRAGRETLRLLVDLEEGNGAGRAPVEFSMEELPPSAGTGATMLGKVQASVRRRMDQVGYIEGQDASIQVVAAPGIRREVETVHNAILGAVWPKDADAPGRPWSRCRFSDIAVLVPDMATYRPMIEAVFDARGLIPYALIDTTASDDSSYLQGFLALMAVARDGLSRETLFAVLDNPCVQRAFSYGPDDVSEWCRYTDEIGAFDGFDEEGDFGNVSWGSALRRLRLGRVATGGDDLVVWDGGDDASALKFSAIVETLHRELSALPGALPCAKPPEERESEGGGTTWADVLRRIANEFLAVEHDDKLEGPVKGKLFGTLSSLAPIEGPQCLDLVVAAVEASVGGVPCRKGGYLTDGVTVAGLQPMRPVPFKQVFVLGMGADGPFPGRDSATTLEIPGARRTLGDMQPTSMKKFLFLETLMAVKERLVLSYPCLDPVKDAELFPSGMVCELEKFLSDSVLKPKKGEDGREGPAAFREVRMPLLERGEGEPDVPGNPVGPIVWTGGWSDGLVPTYSDDERRLARAIAASGRSAPAAPDAPAAPADAPAGPAAPSGERIALKAKELAGFLASPLRAVLRYRHGIGVEGYKDDSIDPDAPLELPGTGPVRWRFERALLEATPADPAPSSPDVETVYRPFADRGELPEADGFLGRCTVEKCKKRLENDDALRDLRRFADGFFAAGGENPDPVRTVLPGAGGEVLFTGATGDWTVSPDGLSSSVLLFNRCGDTGKKPDVKETPFPPMAVLEPFATWMAMAAGADEGDGRTRHLRVGIADAGQLLYNAWTWETTPAAARAWLEALAEGYLFFAERPDPDRTYLDFDYADFAKAFATAREKAEEKGDDAAEFPATDEDWQSVAASFPSDYSFDDGKRFDNGLVVDESVKPWIRSPGGDDATLGRDARILRERYEKWFKPVMAGRRERPETSEED